MMRGGARWRVYLAYWRQWCWFYAWKWTRAIPRLHRLTIRPVNAAREDYLDVHQRLWPKP